MGTERKKEARKKRMRRSRTEKRKEEKDGFPDLFTYFSSFLVDACMIGVQFACMSREDLRYTPVAFPFCFSAARWEIHILRVTNLYGRKLWFTATQRD